jgi:hypothetical protein
MRRSARARSPSATPNSWSGLEAAKATRRDAPARGAPSPDAIGALDEITFALLTGGRVQRTNAEWFAGALEAVIAGRARSLDEALGIKAGRGKRNETLRARVHQAARLRAIRMLADDIAGGASKKAGVLQHWVNGSEEPPTEAGRAVLAELRAQGITLPASESSLYTMVRVVNLKKS